MKNYRVNGSIKGMKQEVETLAHKYEHDKRFKSLFIFIFLSISVPTAS